VKHTLIVGDKQESVGVVEINKVHGTDGVRERERERERESENERVVLGISDPDTFNKELLH
jgi:hypothetical protein